MEASILPVESIQERDVDIILLEELSTDPTFCEWFVRELDLPDFTAVHGAWKSISGHGLGETDLLFVYNSGGQKVYVLIENKLDAAFQNDQFNRYLKRAAQYLREKACHQAFAVLIAPELYCENQNDFESCLTYESIAKRLEHTGTKRHLFRRDLLLIASEKLRRGYRPVNSIPVQRFWHAYWKYKEEKYPHLRMRRPGIIPHHSDWPRLYDDRLQNNVFYHKLGQGNMDATFMGFPEEVELKIKEILPDWATLEKHSKSFSIRVFSGVIDRTRDFEEALSHIETAFQNLERIRDWLIEHKISNA